MHGGRLVFGAHALSQQTLVAAFGSSYYVFAADSQTCRGLFNIGHISDIAGMSEIKNQQFLSVDHSGVCITFQIAKDKARNTSNLLTVVQKFQLPDEKGKKCKDPICPFISLKGQVYFIGGSDNKLRKYSAEAKSTVTIAHKHSFVRILSLCEKWVIAQCQDDKIVCVSVSDGHELKEYSHSHGISSAVVSGQSLIIGDRRGKILVLNGFLSKKVQPIYTTKLEWHTGPVNCLKVSGQYLYSAGEESVIVLWHLRDLSRDFLPRVGTAINSLSINQSTNEITCGMSDNSLRIIDLGNDKQIRTFKTITDPQGYAANSSPQFTSNAIHYNQVADQVLMKSLPGRLQSVNFRENGQNDEIEIIPRNLINQLDQNVLKPNRVKSFCLSKDWTTMLVCVEESFRCSLKFYRRRIGNDFELLTKVENPHRQRLDGCLAFSGQLQNKFITFSQSDKSIKLWSEHKQKKKSIVDSDQLFWRCQQELAYRQMTPTSVDCRIQSILALFGSDLVLFKQDQSHIFSERKAIPAKNLKTNKVYLLSEIKKSQKSHIVSILAINEQQNGVKIIEWNIVTNSITVHSDISHKNILNLEVCVGEQMCSVFLKQKNLTHILTCDLKTCSFTGSHKCQGEVEGGFWRGKQLIVISSNLTMQSLDGKDFVNYTSNLLSDMEMEEETMETKQITDNKLDIFGLTEKWMGRELIRNKKNVENTIATVHLLADCSSALDEMVENLLI